MKSLPLFIFLLLIPLAFASIPSCVIKIRVLSPTEGYFAPTVSGGAANILLSFNVTNIGANAPLNATATFLFDNGTAVTVPANATGNYTLSIADTRDGSHTFTVSASATGCISDSVSQQYYYQSSPLRSVPEFNPVLAPLVGFAAIFAARAYGRKRGKK